MKNIKLIIPCLNEEKGLIEIFKSIPYEKLKRYGYKLDILVVDNGSEDNTVEVAKNNKAEVIIENKKGKGNAIIKAFKHLNVNKIDYVVMIDGDNTYKTSEIPRLVELLESDFTDVVIGSRLKGNLLEGSFKSINKYGDQAISLLIRRVYKNALVTDALSGFFVWKIEVVRDLRKYLTSSGFSIEMEMIAKTVKLGYRIHSVPITYDKRKGDTKIRIKDSLIILKAFFKYLNWKPKSKRMQ